MCSVTTELNCTTSVSARESEGGKEESDSVKEGIGERRRRNQKERSSVRAGIGEKRRGTRRRRRRRQQLTAGGQDRAGWVRVWITPLGAS